MEIVFILYVLFLPLTAAWSFAKLSEYVGIFINKALGVDSNLCREALEDGQNMSSFPGRGKRSPWRFLSTLKFLFDQKAARSTALTSAQPKTPLSPKGYRKVFLSSMACRNAFLGLPELYKEDFISLE